MKKEMALQNDGLSIDLLRSQAHIWNHIFSFMNSMSLKCAIQLQIPDIINRHGAPMLLSKLVEALSITKERSHFVYRLMRILPMEERFGILQAKIQSLTSSSTKQWLVMQDLLHVILKHYGGAFEGFNSIVDVGGGTGTLSKAIAKTFPELNCICFDLPHVVNGMEGSKNLSYVGGGMFEAIPKADVVLVKWILHDWSHEEFIKILKRCKEAIPRKENGGKIMIIDMVVMQNHEEGDDSLQTQLFFDMLMMTNGTGRERSEKDWEKLLLDDAEFSDYKITPILGLRSLIEVYP
ncbi:hypothetical protein L6452_01446 [Arctium lappa]|uniref:Uncharacterized protein n=1 Tax=Arctium lappa TaxID=4217 RepID=A0ACB9FG56_ARCLA|nr:hypothetical protein L6452_01446 [Arctium lappa]